VSKILEINNDNYFKRTQILMIVAQAALFTAFSKVLAMKNPKIFEGFSFLTQRIVLVLITAFGAGFAGLWYVFIRRQCNVLALCKGYLRGIEKYLMQLGVPSGYWTYESKLSHPKPRDIQPVIHFTIDPSFFIYRSCLRPFPLTKYNGEPFKDEYCDVLPGKRLWPRRKTSWWWKPSKRRKWRKNGDFQRFWIGLARIEKIIAIILCVAWLFLSALAFFSDC